MNRGWCIYPIGVVLRILVCEISLRFEVGLEVEAEYDQIRTGTIDPNGNLHNEAEFQFCDFFPSANPSGISWDFIVKYLCIYNTFY
jgi:hypothetical protein